MRLYPMKIDDKIYKFSHIGVNHTASNLHIGGALSSYKEMFDNEDEVNMETGIMEIRHCIIGDIREAYEILERIIKDNQPTSLLEYCECVQETILKYFGDYSNVRKRLSYFPDEEEVDAGKKIGQVSDLAHKNVAMCVERAMVSQNLLKTLGFDSTYKISGIIINGRMDAHAYNLLSHEGKYYLFDATIPTSKNGKTSPIICEIPQEVYEKISNPMQDVGIGVHVEHFNPLQNKDYDIVYDAGRKDVFEVMETLTK